MSKYYVNGYTPPGNITSKNEVKTLQASLGVKADGVWGPKTQAAYDAATASNSHFRSNGGTSGASTAFSFKTSGNAASIRYSTSLNSNATRGNTATTPAIGTNENYHAPGYLPPGQFRSRGAVLAEQKRLGVKADGVWGKQTQSAYDEYLRNMPYQQARNTSAVATAPRSNYAERGYTPPASLQSKQDVKRVQAGLGLTQTGVWDARTNAAYMQSRNDRTYTPVKNVYNGNREIDLTATLHAKIDQSRLTDNEKWRAQIILDELEPNGKQWLKEQVDKVGLAAIFSQDSIESRLRLAFTKGSGFVSEIPHSAQRLQRLQQVKLLGLEAKEMELESKERELEDLNAYFNALPAWEKTRTFGASEHPAETDKRRIEGEIAALRQELGLPAEKSFSQKIAETLLAIMFPLTGCAPKQTETEDVVLSISSLPSPEPRPQVKPSPSASPENSPYLYMPGMETPEPTPTNQLLSPTRTPSVEECVESPAKLTEEEKTILAVIAAEADLRNRVMIKAVADVITNRVNHKDYTLSSAYDAVTSGGFSGYGNDAYNNAMTFFETGTYPKGGAGSTARMEQVIQIGLPICRGEPSDDITNGAIEFRDPSTSNGGVPKKAIENPEQWEEVFIEGIDPKRMRFWRKLV